jgi:hypothetical protein
MNTSRQDQLSPSDEMRIAVAIGVLPVVAGVLALVLFPVVYCSDPCLRSRI